MADSKQLQIIKSIQAQLATINPANDDPNTGVPYEIDLTDATFRGRVEIGENDPQWAITILENPKPVPTEFLAGERLNRKHIETLTLLLQGFAPNGDDLAPTDNAYRFKAMVEQVLSRIIETNPNGTGGVYEEYLLGQPYLGFSPPDSSRLITTFTIQTGGVRPASKGVSATAFFYLPLVIQFAFNPANPYQ